MMKKISIPVYLMAALLLFFACDTPYSDAKKMHRRQRVLLEYQQKAVRDSVLTDEEINRMLEAYKENLGFNRNVSMKYETDTTGMASYMEHLNAMNQDMDEHYTSVNKNLKASEGYDEFRKKLLELYFGK
ncbi:MAG: hypothetical protein ACLFM1_10585 [Bacteroidales bacterium]